MTINTSGPNLDNATMHFIKYGIHFNRDEVLEHLRGDYNIRAATPETLSNPLFYVPSLATWENRFTRFAPIAHIALLWGDLRISPGSRGFLIDADRAHIRYCQITEQDLRVVSGRDSAPSPFYFARSRPCDCELFVMHPKNIDHLVTQINDQEGLEHTALTLTPNKITPTEGVLKKLRS